MKTFFDACKDGDADLLRALLLKDPQLARATDSPAPHPGWTGLHSAAGRGHLVAVRLLLEHGADPNAREAGDNTYPLHWAAAHGNVEIVRTLLDAGGDVHGFGDVHEFDVIGWATFYHTPGDEPTALDPARRPLVALLVERGAKHHIFSAMSVGDLDLIRQVVETNTDSLKRRMSRFEQRLTPLHFAILRKRYDILDLLIRLGADLDAEDGRGQTALTTAMLRGDAEATRRLQAAGAKPPTTIQKSNFTAGMAAIASSVTRAVPMIYVPDVARALDWYVSIGFKETERFGDDGVVNFGIVSFGNAELMLNMHGRPAPHDVSLWFNTDRVDDLYELIKAQKLADPASLVIEQEIEDMFYGARQFCILDLNGYQLYFIQSKDA